MRGGAGGVTCGRYKRARRGVCSCSTRAGGEAMTPFLLAIALDCIYQLMTVRFVYPLELVFTATLLALVPYALLRGPFNRLARLLLPAARAPPVGPTHDNTFIR